MVYQIEAPPTSKLCVVSGGGLEHTVCVLPGKTLECEDDGGGGNDDAVVLHVFVVYGDEMCGSVFFHVPRRMVYGRVRDGGIGTGSSSSDVFCLRSSLDGRNAGEIRTTNFHEDWRDVLGRVSRRIARDFRASLCEIAGSSLHLRGHAIHATDFRYEAPCETSFGQPPSKAFVCSPEFLSRWLMDAANLFLAISGLRVGELGDTDYERGKVVWTNLLVVACGPYGNEPVDSRSAPELVHMDGNDCDSIAATFEEIHRMSIDQYHDLQECCEKVGGHHYKDAKQVVLYGLRWAHIFTRSECFACVVYADPQLEYAGKPFDAHQANVLQLHQALLLQLRSRPEEVAFVEPTCLVSPPALQSMFSHPFGPAVGGYGRVTAFNAARYKSFVSVESASQLWYFKESAGHVVGSSYEDVVGSYRQSRMVPPARKQRVPDLPPVVVPVDDPAYLAYLALTQGPSSKMPPVRSVQATQYTTACSVGVLDGPLRLRVGCSQYILVESRDPITPTKIGK